MNREEEILHRVLAVEAAKVDVEARALAEIRQKITARRTRWWRPFTFLTGTTVALTAGIAAVVIGFGSCVPPRPGRLPPAGSGPITIGGFEASAGSFGVMTLALPVYYLGSSPGGPLLYREYHRLPAGDGSPGPRTAAAVTEMLGGRAFDPDYTSSWPASSRLREVRLDGDVVTVDLTGVGVNGAGAATAGQAVQQLIWTATAASGLAAVRLLFDGQQVDPLWGQVPAGGVLRRASAVDVLAPVWLIDPQHGASVGKTFTVKLAGIVFGGMVQIRVRDSANSVVHEQSVQLTRPAPDQGEATLRVTVSPGTYTVDAYRLAPNDGSEQGLDNHTITVG